MFKKCHKINLLALSTLACILWALCWATAPAQVTSQGPPHAGHHQGHAVNSTAAKQSPHGGQVTATQSQSFEVVYRPAETRVYVYGADGQPATARGVKGQAAMQVRGNEKVYRYPLQYVAQPAGSRDQDYLAAAVDVSRIRDGEMKVVFELTNLPSRQQPQTLFTQTFALTKSPLTVTVAALGAADRAGIARQKVCVVSGGKLGAMGTPIKVLIGNQPVYLCCKGCLGKVQQNPEFYLRKATPAQAEANRAAPAGQIRVAKATAADRAAIAQQKICVVTKGKLGAMGTPVKVTIRGQSLFLCCQGCVNKVKKNPDHYLSVAAQLRAGH